MTDIAIRVEKLSKHYRIGQREPYKALRDVLPQLITALFRRLKEIANCEIHDPQSDFIWALKDVSLEVKRGDVLTVSDAVVGGGGYNGDKETRAERRDDRGR